MKFNRIKLIERIDEIEAQRKKAHDDASAPRLAAWEQAVKEWKAKGGPKLAAVLREFAKKAAAGGLVTSEDISRAVGSRYRRGNLCFEGAKGPDGRYMSERPVKSEYRPDRDLAALRALLVQTTSDEYVTSSALREMGFKPSAFIKAVSA